MRGFGRIRDQGELAPYRSAASRHGEKPPSAFILRAPLTPAAVVSLQRTAGNAAAVLALQRESQPGTKPEASGAPREEAVTTGAAAQRRAELLPFERTFRQELESTVLFTPWPRLEGVGLSKAASGEVWNLVLEAYPKDENIPEERVVRESMYAAAARIMNDHLNIKQSTKNMALWSGGIDTKNYAEQRGFTMLESSNVGRALTRIQGATGFPKGALWSLFDQFTKIFVRRAAGDVHVFMRNHDVGSSLFQTEFPILKGVLMERDPLDAFGHPPQVSALLWHALWGHPLQPPCELDEKGDKVDSYVFADKTGDLARQALKKRSEQYPDEAWDPKRLTGMGGVTESEKPIPAGPWAHS
jgi:hypothetical protein